MTIVNRLTENDFTELCAVLCPYCRVKLPMYENGFIESRSARKSFVHEIPGAGQTFECGAAVVKAARDGGAV